ncbi:WD40-repeat-containing domain protein [Dunaliella salina]|uniref:WD40-repeat-containing domain protein n=1 Tax=Dunaliella salina TaxID=3046 RepID=A0ABQ7G1X5_DUNSA|nr:WD40-repeat-containing domain protein [Dunaliella salina]|eukprot:KAF5828596.1 WD40-repeat-containing domain protein [Dunaliella salina]
MLLYLVLHDHDHATLLGAAGVGPSGEGFKDRIDLLWDPVGDLDLQAPGSTATTTPNKPPARWQVGTAEPQGCSPKQQLASSSLSRISAGGEPATEQAQPRPPRTAEQEEAELAEAIRLSLLEMEQQRGNSGKQESKTVQDALYSKQAAWMPQALFAASEADLWFTPAAAAAAERKMDKKTKTQQRQEMARKVQLAEQEEAANAAMSQQHQQHQQQQQQQAVPPTQLLSSPTWSTIFTKNKDPISSVAFTPDGSTLVSGFAGYGEDGTSIKLWDLASGNCTATLKEHSDQVQSVAISRDGGVAVSGSSDKTVKLWNLDSRECTATLTGHTKKVNGVAISSDGATIASAAWDGTVRIFKWDAQCWYMWTLLKYSCLMDCVTFSSDGTHLANGGTDCSVWVWDVRSGQSIAELQGHGWGVESVLFSQDGATVLSGSRDKTIKVWDVRSGRCERTLKGHKDGVQSLALTADGQQAVSGSGALFFNSDTTIKIWDWRNSGECLATLKGHKNEVSSVAVSPDGKTLASGSADRTIRLWEFGRR